MILALLAQGGGFFGEKFEEITAEPLLVTACVVLVAVALEWIVVARLIIRNYRKAARRGLIVNSQMDVVRSPRDIWSYPPPETTEQPARNPGDL
jgi:uncharacterized membrane protein